MLHLMVQVLEEMGLQQHVPRLERSFFHIGLLLVRPQFYRYTAADAN